MSTEPTPSQTQPVPRPAAAGHVRPSLTDAVITALAEVVDTWTGEPPITAAVIGWKKAGRPDIAELLSRRVAERGHIVCAFNAFKWERESRPAAAMLAGEVARAAGLRRRRFRRAFDPVATEMSSPQTRWWRRLTAAVTSAVLAAIFVALPGVRDAVASLAGKDGVIGDLAAQATRTPVATVAVLAALFWVVAVRAWNMTTAIARFASSARNEAARGTFDEVRGQLAKLIRQALRGRKLNRRFVVVINNIDGCGGEFALALCEDANKLLGLENVVLVFVGELGTMEEAANQKFSLPAGTPEADRRGREHIRALIPNILALSRPSADDVRSRET